MDRMSLYTFAADPVSLALLPDPEAGPAAERLVTGRVVPFDEPTDRGFFDAVFTAADLRLPADLGQVKLLTEHDPQAPVGYATDAQYRADGLWMTFAVPQDHPRAAGYLADLDANLRDGFSVGVRMDEATRNAITAALFDGRPAAPIVMAGEVSEVSGVTLPQYATARATQFSSPVIHFSERPEAMPAPAAPPATAPAPAELAADPVLTMEQFAADLRPFLSVQEPHPLAKFATLAEFAAAAWDGAASFALLDQTTPANPGVVPPGWVNEIAGIVDLGRPVITATGGAAALPPSGMEIDWPYYDGDITALVGKQATQKTDITSVLVSLKKGVAPISTFAGGSDISYQLIRRSSPAYLDAYLRIMAAGFAAATENDYEDSLLAAATAYVHPTTNADQIRAALFAASSKVFRATGKPATVVAVATDVWEAWGGMSGLVPGAYGTQNVPGTAQASTLQIDVSGLPVIEAPYLAAGSIIVTNDLAARWHEDGPYTVAADDVAKLGQNTAVWGMGATRVSAPAGLIKITAAAE